MKFNFSMKKQFGFLIAVTFALCLVFLTSCTEDETERALNSLSAIHKTTRAVITDPEIVPLIPDETMLKLSQLEIKYLTARSLFETVSGAEEGQTMKTMIACAAKLVDLLEEMSYLDKYEEQIKIARVTIRVLLVQMVPD